MEALTGYHEKLIELGSGLVDHGYGEMMLVVESLKDNSVRVTIHCGKSYVYFIKRDLDSNTLGVF